MMKSMLNSTSMQLSPCEAVLSSVPDNGIEFGYCGVQQEIRRSITLTNPSASQVRFSITSQEDCLFSANINQGR